KFDTPGGPLTMPVAGVIRDFQDPRGVIYVAASLYQRYWRDDRWDKFRVFTKPSAPPEEVRKDILDRIGADTPLTVLTRSEVEQFIFNPMGQQMKASYAQVTLGALVALLALLNLLALSVVERRGTLATFRVLGAHKKELRRTLLIEASLVAGISVLAGAITGAVGLRLVLDATYTVIAGVRLEYIYPASLALWCLPVALGAATLASVWPAEAAFKAPLIESLAYE
ncbi:MAG TPA: ABC transporter permease, partial [Bryobacteraceae bacterium]|nr:ABC transporter permease [Bryobacteraceae bacterium]